MSADAQPTQSPDPQQAGNAVDGSTAGDGDQGERRTTSAGPAGADPASDPASDPSTDAGTPGQPASGRDREEEKRIYRTPEPEGDSAVGGSEGTTDGA